MLPTELLNLIFKPLLFFGLTLRLSRHLVPEHHKNWLMVHFWNVRSWNNGTMKGDLRRTCVERGTYLSQNYWPCITITPRTTHGTREQSRWPKLSTVAAPKALAIMRVGTSLGSLCVKTPDCHVDGISLFHKIMMDGHVCILHTTYLRNVIYFILHTRPLLTSEHPWPSLPDITDSHMPPQYKLYYLNFNVISASSSWISLSKVSTWVSPVLEGINSLSPRFDSEPSVREARRVNLSPSPRGNSLM